MRVLHVAGATTTRFYRDLSLTYQRNVIRPAGTRAALMTVDPDGTIALDGRPLPRSAALEQAARFDLVVPHMFCKDGMTAWRALFETVLGVPVIGPPLDATVTATSKLATKAVARDAGIRTAKAERLIPGAPVPRLDMPAIVKPDSEDNSLGLTLVRDPADLPAAIAHALAHDRVALAEAFIPGREVRVGVIEDPAPRVLPILEYHVSDAHPIRVRADKVAVDDGGAVTMGAWERPSLETSCPAALAPDLLAELRDAALRMHAALGSRDYSLFDFRIAAGTGRPYLLEACSFWTFTPISVISKMLAAEGAELEAVALRMWRRAGARRERGPVLSDPAPVELS